jgi:hypothetical protein
VTGRWFFPGPPVSSTNKTDHQNITEILLKVALNTINQTKPIYFWTCRVPCEHFFSSVISWREEITFQQEDDDVHFVLDQQA